MTPFALLVSLALLSLPLFWFTDLDLRVAAWFYRPEDPQGPWPLEHLPLVRLFYYGAPWFVALFGGGALGVLLWGLVRPVAGIWRVGALLFLLTLAVGPGLLVNWVFKDHWGRPRPRQALGLGGDQPYVPPLRPVPGDSKSFPAGHPSVGFSLCAFWVLWRRRHPRRARLALAIALGLGGLMGWARMAAGAHFLSDVLWAGFLTCFTSIGLYYWVLRIPGWGSEAPARPRPGIQPGLLVGGIAAALLLVLGGLLNTPVRRDLDRRLDGPLPSTLVLWVDRGPLILAWATPGDPAFQVRGRVRGFALPGARVVDQTSSAPGRLEYHLGTRGLFYELEMRSRIALDPTDLRVLEIHVERGCVRLPPPVAGLRMEVDAPANCPGVTAGP